MFRSEVTYSNHRFNVLGTPGYYRIPKIRSDLILETLLMTVDVVFYVLVEV